MPSEHDKAYAAGLFDGRGYVRIGCQKGRTPRLTVYLSMPLTYADWFKERWPPGKCYQARTNITYTGSGMNVSPPKFGGGGNVWSIDRLGALEFLRDIQPYVVHRRQFVHLSIKYLERVVMDGEKFSDDLAVLVSNIRRIGRLPY